jgi:glycyl-tRNA synthetase
VIETSVGIDRTTLALLANGYEEEILANGENRTVMHIAPHLAPYTAAVLPLSKKVAEPAEQVAKELRRHWNVFFDISGNIGRRYRRQDEVGTPYCLTYDFDSEKDGKVTIRDRDTMEQERVATDSLVDVLNDRLSAHLV